MGLVVLWCPHHHHQCFFLEAAVMGMQVNSRVDWGWPMTALLETHALSRAWGFAEDQISGTRQRHSLPRASHRSPRQRTALGKYRPTANQIFVEGRGPRQRCPRQIRPVGSRRPFPSSFAEGHPLGPRQRFIFFCKTSFSAKFFLKKSLCRGP